MTSDEKTLGHRYHADLLERGDLDLVDRLFAKDCVTHYRYMPPEWQNGKAGIRAYAAMLRTAFPDGRTAEEDVVTGEDKQGIRWTFTGTHRGEFLGIASTGRQVAVSGYSIFRVAGGKIQELWIEQDLLALLQQLGAIPAQGQPSH